MIGTPSNLRPGEIIHEADNDTRGFDWAADPKDFVVRVLVANRHYSMRWTPTLGQNLRIFK